VILLSLSAVKILSVLCFPDAKAVLELEGFCGTTRFSFFFSFLFLNQASADLIDFLFRSTQELQLRSRSRSWTKATVPFAHFLFL